MDSLLTFFLEQNSNYDPTLTEREAICEFERLSPIHGWRPANPHLLGFLPVLEIGILATLLRKAQNSRAVLLKAIKCVQSGKAVQPSLLAELHVGALIHKFEPNIKYVLKQRKSRTPDLVAYVDSIDEVIPIDVEVVCSDEKREHIEHRNLQQTLAEAIGTENDRNFAIFVADTLSDDLCMQVVDQMLRTKPGNTCGIPGSWQVVVGFPAEGDDFTGGAALAAMKPNWWEDRGTFQLTTRRVGGAYSPVTTIVTPVPPATYLNPIRRKAERAQRTGKNPYLIALDSRQTHGAHRQVGSEISEWLKQWPHVAAILIEYPFFAKGQQKWRCFLLRNPYANLPIPNEFLEALKAEVTDVLV